MVSTKLVFVLLVALGACQVQAAHVPAQPKTVQEFITLVIEIVDDVAQGIQDVVALVRDPIDKLIAELNPKLGAQVKTLLDDIDQLALNLLARIQNLEKQVNDALTQLNTEVGSCVDTTDTELLQVLDKYEGLLAVLFNTSADKIKDVIAIFESQLRDLLRRAGENDNGAIDAGLKCVTDKVGVKDCLDANSEKWKTELLAIAVDAVLDINQVLPDITKAASEVIEGGKVLITQLIEETSPVFDKFGACVEATA